LAASKSVDTAADIKAWRSWKEAALGAVARELSSGEDGPDLISNTDHATAVKEGQETGKEKEEQVADGRSSVSSSDSGSPSSTSTSGVSSTGLRLGSLVDAKEAKQLEVALGDAARKGEKPCGLFAHPGARAGYTLKHLSR
jgi:hypothetical protein